MFIHGRLRIEGADDLVDGFRKVSEQKLAQSTQHPKQLENERQIQKQNRGPREVKTGKKRKDRKGTHASGSHASTTRGEEEEMS